MYWKGAAAVAVAALAGGAAALGQVIVVEDAANVGLSAVHSPEPDGFPGNQERMTGGVAIGDFNRDGFNDVYWVSGGLIPDKLFINNGDGTFSDQALADLVPEYEPATPRYAEEIGRAHV